MQKRNDAFFLLSLALLLSLFFVLVIWSLDIGAYLEFGAWNLEFGFY